MFQVTKQFTSGFFKGLTVTEKTSVMFLVGKEYKPCAGNSSYVVLSCVAI